MYDFSTNYDPCLTLTIWLKFGMQDIIMHIISLTTVYYRIKWGIVEHAVLWTALVLNCRHILTILEQMTFENIVAKGEIAYNEQFIHLPKCFQLFSINKLSCIEIIYGYA